MLNKKPVETVREVMRLYMRWYFLQKKQILLGNSFHSIVSCVEAWFKLYFKFEIIQNFLRN